MRKVKYGIIILLNYIYVPLKCILSGFHFHATLPQLITPGTKIEIGGGGRISLFAKSWAYLFITYFNWRECLDRWWSYYP